VNLLVKLKAAEDGRLKKADPLSKYLQGTGSKIHIRVISQFKFMVNLINSQASTVSGSKFFKEISTLMESHHSIMSLKSVINDKPMLERIAVFAGLIMQSPPEVEGDRLIREGLLTVKEYTKRATLLGTELILNNIDLELYRNFRNYRIFSRAKNDPFSINNLALYPLTNYCHARTEFFYTKHMNEFSQQIGNIAALKKLTNFEPRSISFTHQGANYIVAGGTWCNVYQTRPDTRTILLRAGCRPKAYLDGITTCMVDAMAMRIFCSLDDLATLLKTTEALSYKYTVVNRRLTTESQPTPIEMVFNNRHYETDFSCTTVKTLYLTTVTYTQNENLQVQGNIDNWKVLWAIQDHPPIQQITVINKGNTKPITCPGPAVGRGAGRGAGRGNRRGGRGQGKGRGGRQRQNYGGYGGRQQGGNRGGGRARGGYRERGRRGNRRG
jgi:hypothetical protein